jgi:hypothetical protein
MVTMTIIMKRGMMVMATVMMIILEKGGSKYRGKIDFFEKQVIGLVRSLDLGDDSHRSSQKKSLSRIRCTNHFLLLGRMELLHTPGSLHKHHDERPGARLNPQVLNGLPGAVEDERLPAVG